MKSLPPFDPHCPLRSSLAGPSRAAARAALGLTYRRCAMRPLTLFPLVHG